MRNDMIKKARKQHFRIVNTVAFDARSSTTAIARTSSQDAQRAAPLLYNFPERTVVVQLMCQPAESLTDKAKLTWSIRMIEARTALCRRQESRRHRRLTSPPKQELSNTSTEDPEEDTEDRFPLVCKPTQCPSASHIWSVSLSMLHLTR